MHTHTHTLGCNANFTCYLCVCVAKADLSLDGESIGATHAPMCVRACKAHRRNSTPPQPKRAHCPLFCCTVSALVAAGVRLRSMGAGSKRLVCCARSLARTLATVALGRRTRAYRAIAVHRKRAIVRLASHTCNKQTLSVSCCVSSVSRVSRRPSVAPICCCQWRG